MWEKCSGLQRHIHLPIRPLRFFTAEEELQLQWDRKGFQGFCLHLQLFFPVRSEPELFQQAVRAPVWPFGSELQFTLG